MKKLLLAFALIGFMATSYAATAVLPTTNTEMTEGEPDKCDKKDCKHDSKECANKKKACKKGDKKECKKSDAKKACCSKDAKKSCHSKDAKKADKK